MKKIALFALILITSCSTPTSQSSVTLAPTIPPTDTSVPTNTPTLTPTPLPPKLTEGDKQIWEAAPETMAEVVGSQKAFRREWGVVYEKDGNVVGLWEYNPYNFDLGNVRNARMENGKLVFVTLTGEEKIRYPEIINVTLSGNRFSEIDLYTTARNFELNPILETKEDHLEMLALLKEAYRLGLIMQFSENSMQLGGDDFEMGPLGWRTGANVKLFFEETYEDFINKKWKSQNTRPFVPLVFPTHVDNITEIPVIMKQKDGTISAYWGLDIIQNEYTKFNRYQNAQSSLDFDMLYSGGHAAMFPMEFKTISDCNRIVGRSEMEQTCEDIYQDSNLIRHEFISAISNGFITEKLKSGEVKVFILSNNVSFH